MNLICSLTGHKFHTIKQLVTGFRKIGCKRCKKEWLMGDHTRALVEWNDVFDRSNVFNRNDHIPMS
jgi:hypothetical protein